MTMAMWSLRLQFANNCSYPFFKEKSHHFFHMCGFESVVVFQSKNYTFNARFTNRGNGISTDEEMVIMTLRLMSEVNSRDEVAMVTEEFMSFDEVAMVTEEFKSCDEVAMLTSGVDSHDEVLMMARVVKRWQWRYHMTI